MSISPDEARAALAAVRDVQQRARRSIALAGGGPILMIWGCVWVIGYLGGHFIGYPKAGVLWMVVDILGLVATLLVVGRVSRRVRDPVGPRIGLFWLLLISYGAFWIWLSRPADSPEIGLMAATLAMFGYVVLGLWIDLVFLWIGLGVTALGIGFYLLAPGAFDLWMGLIGGGTLILSGAYIQRSWR